MYIAILASIASVRKMDWSISSEQDKRAITHYHHRQNHTPPQAYFKHSVYLHSQVYLLSLFFFVFFFNYQ